MLQDRKELEVQLNQIFSVISLRKSLIEEVQKRMSTQHGMLAGEVNNWLLGMQSLDKASDEELFWFAQTVLGVLASTSYSELTTKIILSQLYSKSEQRLYSHSTVSRIKDEIYPLVFDNVLQINDDQWVTKIDVNQLLVLSKHQLINYNRLTQRPSKEKYVAGFAAHAITLKRKSVQEISQQLRSNMFISNDITFNLNMDNPDVEFTFVDNQLILTSGLLDIIDGWHRYRAAMETKSAYPDFNYQFILNIMNFDEAKACRYIAQQDKRNKINASFSKAMDSSDPINIIIKRLNEDTACYLCGKIGRLGDEIINSIHLFTTMKFFYVNKIETKDVVALVKKVRTIINSIMELDSTIFNHPLTFKEVAFIALVTTLNNDEFNAETIVQRFHALDTFNSVQLNRGQLTKTSGKEFDEWLRKEGTNNVQR